MEAKIMYEQDLFNEPTWVPPIELPDLSKETIIAIDVETCDPNLLTLGPGWSRNDGQLLLLTGKHTCL